MLGCLWRKSALRERSELLRSLRRVRGLHRNLRRSVVGGVELVARRSYRPTMDTFTELRQLVDDLTELGDKATAALVRQAIDRFSAWKFEAGERLLERA